MSASHEGPNQSDQGPVSGASAGDDTEKLEAKRVDRRRVLLTGMAAGPVLMTLGTSAAKAQTLLTTTTTTSSYTTNYKDKTSSGMTSGNSSIVKKKSW